MNPSDSGHTEHPTETGHDQKSVREVLLNGIFIRILIIEGILLVWSVGYRFVVDMTDITDLLWYTLRILVLVAIIIGFMMITLRRFLDRKIISPLEMITAANRRFREDGDEAQQVNLPARTPREIGEIVTTRKELLANILKVSRERLALVDFIRATFGRYLSKEIVEEILASPEGRTVGGRRATVTILMSDLRGFTTLSEERDPEQLMELLNRYLQKMTEVIQTYGGMIDEFIGDAILVVFGVPEPMPDDAARAVACGLAMQKALMQLNNEIVKEGYPPLEMGIGINTGTVIAGNIGSEMRLKYGIVGAPVNIASRIESDSVGGQVLVGLSTYEQVSHLVTAETARTVMMKGVKAPIVYYPVTAIGPPYNVRFNTVTDNQTGIPMTLPFQCWTVDDKKVSAQAIAGETVTLGRDFLAVKIGRPLPPLTNLKLMFDFCVDAHCFEDIYAKVISQESQGDQIIYQMRITSISKADRDLLKRWMEQAN
jgi:class 3 adenylate cyclase